MIHESFAEHSPYRGRFAPSPTGALHFGSLVAALGSWLRARAAGGAWLIRIEDIDPPRERAGAAADILETLQAFGMTSDAPINFHNSAAHAATRTIYSRCPVPQIPSRTSATRRSSATCRSRMTSNAVSSIAS